MDTLTLSTRLLNEYGVANYSETEQARKTVRLSGMGVLFAGVGVYAPIYTP
jgi:hypothetical protein